MLDARVSGYTQGIGPSLITTSQVAWEQVVWYLPGHRVSDHDRRDFHAPILKHPLLLVPVRNCLQQMAPTTPANHDPAPATPVSQSTQAISQNITPADIPNLQLDQQQIMNLLRSLPQLALQYPPPTGIPGINDPGPSSHPRGPPNLEQLSAVAMQAAPVKQQAQPPRPEDGVPEQDGSQSPAGAGTNTSSAGGRRSARSATMGTDEWSRQRKDNHVSILFRFKGNKSMANQDDRKRLNVAVEEISTKVSTS